MNQRNSFWHRFKCHFLQLYDWLFLVQRERRQSERDREGGGWVRKREREGEGKREKEKEEPNAVVRCSEPLFLFSFIHYNTIDFIELTYYAMVGYYVIKALNTHFYRIMYPSSLLPFSQSSIVQMTTAAKEKVEKEKRKTLHKLKSIFTNTYVCKTFFFILNRCCVTCLCFIVVRSFIYFFLSMFLDSFFLIVLVVSCFSAIYLHRIFASSSVFTKAVLLVGCVFFILSIFFFYFAHSLSATHFPSTFEESCFFLLLRNEAEFTR